jgi:chromate transporter
MPSLLDLVKYFLRLGALGFGGPVALADSMRRDLVDARRWITPEEYEDGLALAAACPGPLAYQLGVYCGYVRHGVVGGLAVALAFGLPPFAIVVTAAALYLRFAANWWLRALFYGIGPAVVALIVKACWSLGRRMLRSDRPAWAFAIVACTITVILQREIVLLFVAAGILGIVVFGRVPSRVTPLVVAAPSLFLFFFKTGLLVFGSGLVIVPLLKTQVVDQYHWLSDRQFLDAVAIGMISPGPVVITATFVGYLLDGFLGALAATAGIFAPPVLFVVCATPLLLRYRSNPALRGFIRGIGSAVVGVLVGTTWLIGRAAIGDWPTLLIAAVAMIVLIRWSRLPEPLIIGTAGVIGLIVYQVLRPAWVLH